MNEEEVENMDMPCMCDCGNWFDLNKGYLNWDGRKRICEECHEKEEEENEEED